MNESKSTTMSIRMSESLRDDIAYAAHMLGISSGQFMREAFMQQIERFDKSPSGFVLEQLQRRIDGK